MEALPEVTTSDRPISLLRRWELSQTLVRHFWKRWSVEYLSSLQRLSKWQFPSKNLSVGDVVILREDGMGPAQWPLAKIVKVHTGRDGQVRVVTAKTAKGTYT